MDQDYLSDSCRRLKGEAVGSGSQRAVKCTWLPFGSQLTATRCASHSRDMCEVDFELMMKQAVPFDAHTSVDERHGEQCPTRDRTCNQGLCACDAHIVVIELNLAQPRVVGKRASEVND